MPWEYAPKDIAEQTSLGVYMLDITCIHQFDDCKKGELYISGSPDDVGLQSKYKYVYISK